MRTIQMTLDDDLVNELDSIVKESNTNRSAFARDALRKAITCYHQFKLAEKHRKGYQQKPVQTDEFSVWEDEQAWGSE
ncbi:MAG: ribbon-helix-helix domain-containing protein [Thiolinea sp.]